MPNAAWKDKVLAFLLPLLGSEGARERVTMGRALLDAKWGATCPRPPIAAFDLAEWCINGFRPAEMPSYVVEWPGKLAGEDACTRQEKEFPGSGRGDEWALVVAQTYSSFIEWTQYSPSKRLLRIAFSNGGVREYSGIRMAFAMNFSTPTAGVGKIFNREVKHRIHSLEIVPPRKKGEA